MAFTPKKKPAPRRKATPRSAKRSRGSQGTPVAPRNVPPKPMCFVAMPFGKKAPPGKRAPLVDFDAIANVFRRAVEAEGLEYIRADLETNGGFINRAMYERLLVAEYVLADITFANANVMYEVGVRHGASARPTLLVGSQDSVAQLPFDLRSFRLVTYPLTQRGTLSSNAAATLQTAIRERLRAMKDGTFPGDNPIMQVTAWRPLGRAEHEKIDVFLGRLAFAGELGAQVAQVLALPVSAPRVERLTELEQQILRRDGVVVEQLYTALLGIFLGYRELEAYDRMASLFDRLPRDLQQTVVVREQYAFALNRRAEVAEKRAREARKSGRLAAEVQAARDEATGLRNAALLVLDSIAESAVTSETFGIRGRVYKGWADAEDAAEATETAKGLLARAIALYEEGFCRDLRDFYPGVNAVTLRVTRDDPRDREAVEALVPVVRFAVDSARPPKNDEERYWRAATKLELACVAGDWTGAQSRRNDVIAARVPSKPWMLQTTADTLRRLRARSADGSEAARELDRHITALEEGRNERGAGSGT